MKLLLIGVVCLASAAAQTITMQPSGPERSADAAFREQVVDTSKPGSHSIDLEVPGEDGSRVRIHAETGKGTEPIIVTDVARIGGFYRYSYRVMNGKTATQSIVGLRLNWEVRPEDETTIARTPIGWRSPARLHLIAWSTDQAPITQDQTVDGFVVDSKLAPGLVGMLVRASVPRPLVDPHRVNTAALTGPGDPLGIEAIFNVPLVLGPKLEPTQQAIRHETAFALTRSEFAAMSDKTPLRPRLSAMAGHTGQRLEQDFTELQQLDLTQLQRQWASEMTQIIRLLAIPPRGAATSERKEP